MIKYYAAIVKSLPAGRQVARDYFLSYDINIMTEKFTPEQQIPLKKLKPIIREAERHEINEAARAGSIVLDEGPKSERQEPEKETVRPPKFKSKKYVPKNVFIEKSFKDN